MKTQFFVIFFLLPIFISAQVNSYHEELDDAYLPLSEKKYSAPFKSKSSNISIIQVNTSVDFMNIIGDAANEPSLAINPLNPNEMVIGWRQFDNIASNFRQAGIAYSQDGGLSWNNIDPLEAGLFRSDPVLACNSDGKFYYNSLTQSFSCDVFSSVNQTDWSDKTSAFGGDKQWMVVDKTTNPSNGNLYAFWKEQFSVCVGNFTRSIDDGISYEDCSLVTDNPIRGTMSIDPDGILYACGGWSTTHRILRSSSAKDPNSEVTWELNKIVNLQGSQAERDGPNPSGLLGQVWIATDHSDTENYGNVYLLSSTERNNNNDPCDIMFSRSLDRGESWSEAIEINDDNSTENWQWFGTMSTAPNGRIDIVWLDTRDNPGTLLSSLYYSFSIDGGESWSVNEKMSDAFDPHLGWPNQQKIGDYFHMVSTDQFAYLAWAATFNGEQDIYFSIITPDSPATGTTDVFDSKKAIISPNPFRGSIEIKTDSEIAYVTIFDLNGQAIHKTNFNDHSNEASISLLNHLSQGVYLMKIVFEDDTQTIQHIVKI